MALAAHAVVIVQYSVCTAPVLDRRTEPPNAMTSTTRSRPDDGLQDSLPSLPAPLQAARRGTPPAAQAQGADIALEALIPALLATIRNAMGMDVAFVSELIDGKRVFRHVAPATGTVIAAGGTDPIEASWCKHVIDGRLPRFIADASVHYTRGDVEPPPFPVGTHLSVPIVLGDGRIFGTLCTFSFERKPEVSEIDLAVLHAMARLIAVGEDRRRACNCAAGDLHPPSALAAPLQRDLAAIASIDAVPQMLEVICRSTGMGFAAIARVTDTQWVCCASLDEIQFGLKAGSELELETTICNEIRQHHEPVVIEDTAASGPYRTHHTPARYGFRSYISFPILRKDGSFWGTLCAIDRRPASLETSQTRGMFKLFADLVGFHLETHDRLSTSQSALGTQTETARRREQFVAALGHDLRTPLQAIAGGLALVERASEHSARVAPLIRRSIQRISALVEDLMDLARGQLGSGMGVTSVLCTDLAERLTQVVDEIRLARPDSCIDFECRLGGAVWCDPARIVQVAANLLSNAVTHGPPGVPINILATADAEHFTFSSSNLAPQLSPSEVDRLFQPYFRPTTHTGGAGLGLGLYIVSEIAKAHQGVAVAVLQDGRLVITVRIPCSPEA